MQQPTLSDCLFLDLFYRLQDFVSTPGIYIGRCQTAEALMKAGSFVVFDNGADLPFKVTGQVLVF